MNALRRAASPPGAQNIQAKQSTGSDCGPVELDQTDGGGGGDGQGGLLLALVFAAVVLWSIMSRGAGGS